MSEERYAYPLAAPGGDRQGAVGPVGGGWVRGRVVEGGSAVGRLDTGGRLLDFSRPDPEPAMRSGDIVSLRGRELAGVLVVDAAQVLAPALRSTWQSKVQGCQASSRWQAAVAAVREFFAARGFVEVDTPALVRAPGQEPYLDPFVTQLHTPGGAAGPRYLITSPEHHLKQLLGRGCERIFQVCHCFRDGEASRHHRPEFTMVEWYRAWATYREVADDVAALTAHVSQRLKGETHVTWRGGKLELAPPWQRLTVAEAFRSLAGVELPPEGDVAALRQAAWRAGCRSAGADDSWEDVFHKLLLECVEPALEKRGAVLLERYPARLAALAKIGADGRAERFEAYVAGVELANGFSELNDPRDQRRRFMEERQRRRARGAPAVPLDEPFLAAMEGGIPPAGGVALGLDRLLMVLAGADSIDGIAAFPGE